MKKITFIALLLSMFIVGCEPGNAEDDPEEDEDSYGMLIEQKYLNDTEMIS